MDKDELDRFKIKKPPYELNAGVFSRVGMINMKREVSSDDLKKLASKGKDFYTGLSWYDVRGLIGIDAFKYIRELDLNEKEKFEVARWVCRGLRMDLSIRKMKLNRNRRR